MHYLGKLKRRMYRIHLADDGAAQAGDEIFTREENDTQAVGKIVDARAHPDGGSEALAVLQIDRAQQGNLSLGTADGPQITMRSLPYELNPG
jgi:folate-binding Fe-S cluster repair protein YgfZ